MGGINLSETIRPVPGYEMWDYFAYFLMFFSLIGVVLAGEDTSTSITIYLGLVLIVAVFGKFYVLGYLLRPEGTPLMERVDAHTAHFGIVVARAICVAFCLLATVQTKVKKVRYVSVPLIFLMTFYALGRWWTQAGNNMTDTPISTWR